MLIKGVPQRIHSWIESARREQMMTKKEFVISTLERACAGGQQPTLFDEIRDITKIKPNDIPDHDILAAGFPCQPFSLAGV